MINIVVVSHSCLRHINRSVFEHIGRNFGFKIHIIVPKAIISGGKTIQNDENGPDDVTIIHPLSLVGTNPRNYWFENSIELLDKLKPQLIHLDNDPISKQGYLLSKWSKKNGVKLTALTCENLSLYPIDNFKRRGIKGVFLSLMKISLLQIVKNKVGHVFTINKEGKRLYQEYGFKGVSRIPLGFSPSTFYPNDESRQRVRNKLGIHDKFVFAYIGRLVQEKGVDILIKSLATLKEDKKWILLMDRFSDAENTYQSEISSLINEFDLQDRICYFDASHLEVADYVNAADAVVIPSVPSKNWVEQYGRVAPEALACGKTVIASNTGALPELIKSAGVLVEPGNVEILAEALTQIQGDSTSVDTYKTKAIERAKSLTVGQQSELMSNIFLNLIEE